MSRSKSADHEASSSWGSGSINWALLAILSTVVYVLLFYVVTIDDEDLFKIRILAMVVLLLPDALAQQWVGGDPSRFGVLDRLPLLFVGGILLSIAYCAGRLLLSWTKANVGLSRIENTIFALGIGLNVLSLYTLAMGLAGQIRSPFIFFALPFATTACFAWQRYRAGRLFDAASWWDGPSEDDVEDKPTRTYKLRPLAHRFLFAGCVVMFGFIVLGSSLPPWHFDVREYHAQVPREWYEQGRITFLPHNVYANMPLGADIHSIPAMMLFDDWWHGALVGKLIIGCFAGLTALTLLSMGYRFFTPSIGWVAAFAYLITPWVYRISAAGLIDGVLGFYSVATAYALLLSLQHINVVPRLILTGFLAGAAVTCKYPSLLFIVAPVVLALVVNEFRNKVPTRTMTLHVAVLLAAVAIGCGLWFAKNAVLTGNPTYPLLYEVFGGETRTPENAAQWTRAHRTPENGMSISGVRSTLILMWTSDYLSPVLFPLLLVGLFAKRYRRQIVVFASISLFGIAVWWLLTHRLDRFLMPYLPFAAIFAGIGVCRLSHAVWRWFSVGFLAYGFVFAMICVPSRTAGENRFFVSLAELREDVPLEADGSWSHYNEAHRYINDHVPEGNRVMLVGDAQVFDVRRPVIYNTCFDGCVMEQLFAGKSRRDRAAELKSQNITHIFVYWAELDRHRTPGNYGYSDYATRERVRSEFVDDQNLLRRVPLSVDPEVGEIFEVVGWQDWPSRR